MNRQLTLLAALFSAACAAIMIYLLAHDAFGIPRDAIVTDSFGSAAFLAIACAVSATLPKNPG
jgi:hypothetical protein